MQETKPWDLLGWWPVKSKKISIFSLLGLFQNLICPKDKEKKKNFKQTPLPFSRRRSFLYLSKHILFVNLYSIICPVISKYQGISEAN